MTSIEKALRHSNQVLAGGSVNGGSDVMSPSNQWQKRHLLVFYEMLEKSMSNAWDGSAYHLNPSAAPITSFFTANMKTCQVWSLSSFEVSCQLLMNYLSQVSSISVQMTSSTALANEGLFELTWHPSLT